MGMIANGNIVKPVSSLLFLHLKVPKSSTYAYLCHVTGPFGIWVVMYAKPQ
jgi:hypothetical protein